jgi:hypothetical protein
LAQDLMQEILAQPYHDVVSGYGSFGRAAEESAPGDRSGFDDVDDYHGWTASPPEYKDGTPLVWATGWSRSVEITWSQTRSAMDVVGAETGEKRISVTVARNGVPAVVLQAARTVGRPAREVLAGETLPGAWFDEAYFPAEVLAELGVTVPKPAEKDP